VSDSNKSHPAEKPRAPTLDAEAGARRRQRRRKEERVPQRTRVPRWLRELPVDPYTVLAVLLGLLVVGSVLAIGAVHPPVMLGVGALASIAFVLALRLRLGRQPATPMLWPAVTLIALAGFTALQLVPLPLSWLRSFAPGNADVWERALLPLGETARTGSISLDPGATWMEVVRWLSYAGIYTAAAVLAAKRGAKLGITIVFVAAIVAALTTIGHGLAGATEVFGLYEPTFRPRPWHVGPLLNPNNLSAYLNLGLLCGLGLALGNEPPFPRWLLAVGGAVLLGVNVTTASRSGMIVLPVVLLLLASTVEVIGRRSLQARSMLVQARILVGGTLALGVVLALLAGTQQIWKELIDENLAKLEMWGWLEDMAGAFPWVGSGRGTFESVSPAFQPGRASTVYTHAENFVLQWAIEWGIPVAAAALVVLVWQFRPRRLGVGRNLLMAGAWFGVVAVVIQNLLDLGLEIPGLVVALMVVLGSLWGDPKRAMGREANVRLTPRAAGTLVAATAAVCVLVLIGAARGATPDLESDREGLKERLLASQPPRDPEQRAALRDHLRAAMLRHPADPYFPLLGGMLAWQERDQAPIPWLQRALERSLVNGRTHLMLAQVLMEVPARSQALLELRLAVEGDPTLVHTTATLALKWATSTDELLATVPTGEGRATSLDALGRIARDRKVGSLCDRLALEADPDLLGPRQRLAQDIIGALKSKEDCQGEDRARCEAELETHVKGIERARPDVSAAMRLRADLLLALGRPEEAEKLLAESCPRFKDQPVCLRARVQAAAEVTGPELLTKAAKALLSAVCVDRGKCADTATWLGDLHAGRSEWGAAMGYYERAARDKESVEALLKLAGAASRGKMHAQAVRALERALALRGGHDPEISKRLAAERNILLRPMMNH
jgi:tetratricopeptide (TPR) repeat protein